jgi:hypothetical protein
MLRHLALALSITTPCVAQNKSTISPPDLTNIYTGSNNGIPFGGYQSAEQLYQQVDSSLVGRKLLMTGMVFSHSWSGNYAKRTYTMELNIGDAATTPATISDMYTLNFAGTPTMVFSGVLNWPQRSRGFTLPGPYDSPIPFSAPYSYTGTQALCWESYTSKDSLFGTTHYFMAGWGNSTGYPKYWAGTIGTGCHRPGADPLRDRPLTAHGWVNSSTQVYSDYLTFGPPNVPVVLKLGLPANTWSGLPLPLSLGFLGAPAACNLYVAPLFDAISATTDSTGRAELQFPFPFGASTSGVKFRTQWIAFNTGKTAITSVANGLHFLVPYDGVNKIWQVSRNWGTTFGATKPQKSTGRPNGTNGSRSGSNQPFYGLCVKWIHF